MLKPTQTPEGNRAPAPLTCAVSWGSFLCQHPQCAPWSADAPHKSLSWVYQSCGRSGLRCAHRLPHPFLVGRPPLVPLPAQLLHPSELLHTAVHLRLLEQQDRTLGMQASHYPSTSVLVTHASHNFHKAPRTLHSNCRFAGDGLTSKPPQKKQPQLIVTRVTTHLLVSSSFFSWLCADLPLPGHHLCVRLTSGVYQACLGLHCTQPLHSKPAGFFRKKIFSGTTFFQWDRLGRTFLFSFPCISRSDVQFLRWKGQNNTKNIKLLAPCHHPRPPHPESVVVSFSFFSSLLLCFLLPHWLEVVCAVLWSLFWNGPGSQYCLLEIRPLRWHDNCSFERKPHLSSSCSGAGLAAVVFFLVVALVVVFFPTVFSVSM